MARPATSRLKCNPPLGRMPVMQFLRPHELAIDPAYQRSIETDSSEALIRKIAQHWNWDLCQPLVVAARPTGELMVIDGQHRLAAARLRGDIDQLPCTIVHYQNTADEAASFVHLNQQRRPLTKLEIFKAAVASEDPEASAIIEALAAAGLSIAPHTNYVVWKPGMISNIGGIERAWRQYGAAATSAALKVLGAAYPGEVLQYAGSIFPGIAAVCAEDGDDIDVGLLTDAVSGFTQVEWRNAIMKARAANPNLKFAAASAQVVSEAWDEFLGAILSEEAA